MKKFVFYAMIMLIAISGFSQKSAIQTALNHQKNGKLDKAKEYIDKAVVHEKTIVDPKAWFYRGNIYIDIYNSPLEAYKNLDPDALNVAYDSYQKALEYDVKNSYSDEIVQKMPGVGELYFNDGARYYNAGIEAQNLEDSVNAKISFNKAVESFEQAYNIYTKAEINDTTTIYYVSVAAELAEDFPKAKESLEKLISMNYPKAAVYSSLANIYYEQDENTEKAIAVYTEGREKFPMDLNLLLMETNLFLAEGMTAEALDNLKQAAEIDTTNATIFFAIGAKYNELYDDTLATDELRQEYFDEAIVAYVKSVEINPEYFDPYYNLGALYVNKAAAILTYAGTLPFDEQEKYDALKEEAYNYLEVCLPYLEKAHELQPDDISTMVSLKEIYTRLNKLDQVKEMNEKLDSN